MIRTRSMVAGLVLLGLLSLADVAGILLTDGEHPPIEVAAVNSLIGAVCLVLLAFAWRGSRVALGGLIGLRVLSAASAVPAFLVEGVPTGAKAAAAAGIVVTLLGCVLVLPGLRRRVSAPA